MKEMSSILENWEGLYDETSIAATVYTRWYFRFLLSLFHQYSDDVDDRLSFTGNYHFTDAYQNILNSILQEGAKSRFQPICKGAFETPIEANGDHCSYNVAMAMLEARAFLIENMASDPAKWLWRDAHANQYVNLPWSRTKLKFLFDRSVPVGGGWNSVNVSKFNVRKDKDNVVTGGYSSGNYKMQV